jgi:hypothetical protein
MNRDKVLEYQYKQMTCQIMGMRYHVYRTDGSDGQRIITLMDVCGAQRDCNIMDVDIDGSIIAQAPLHGQKYCAVERAETQSDSEHRGVSITAQSFHG